MQRELRSKSQNDSAPNYKQYMQSSSEDNSESDVSNKKNRQSELDQNYPRYYKFSKECQNYIKKMEGTDCDLCGKSFRDIYVLKVHLQKFHQILPNRCNACDNSYNSIKQLKIHIEEQHLGIKFTESQQSNFDTVAFKKSTRKKKKQKPSQCSLEKDKYLKSKKKSDDQSLQEINSNLRTEQNQNEQILQQNYIKEQETNEKLQIQQQIQYGTELNQDKESQNQEFQQQNIIQSDHRKPMKQAQVQTIQDRIQKQSENKQIQENQQLQYKQRISVAKNIPQYLDSYQNYNQKKHYDQEILQIQSQQRYNQSNNPNILQTNNLDQLSQIIENQQDRQNQENKPHIAGQEQSTHIFVLKDGQTVLIDTNNPLATINPENQQNYEIYGKNLPKSCKYKILPVGNQAKIKISTEDQQSQQEHLNQEEQMQQQRGARQQFQQFADIFNLNPIDDQKQTDSNFQLQSQRPFSHQQITLQKPQKQSENQDNQN